MSVIALWVDSFLFQFPKDLPGTGGGLRFGAGLELDYSTLKFSATRMDSTHYTSPLKIARTYSQNHTVSLRIANEAFYSLRSTFGFFFSLNILVPIISYSPPPSSGFANVSAEDEERRKDDLRESINHKKNSFGIEMLLGVR